jgi:hypothetical protein
MAFEKSRIPSIKDLIIASCIAGPVAATVFWVLLDLSVKYFSQNSSNIETNNTILENAYWFIRFILIFGFLGCAPFGFMLGLLFRKYYFHKNAIARLAIIGFVGPNIPVVILAVVLGGSNAYFGIEPIHFVEFGLLLGISGVAAGIAAIRVLRYRLRSMENSTC